MARRDNRRTARPGTRLDSCRATGTPRKAAARITLAEVNPPKPTTAAVLPIAISAPSPPSLSASPGCFSVRNISAAADRQPAARLAIRPYPAELEETIEHIERRKLGIDRTIGHLRKGFAACSS